MNKIAKIITGILALALIAGVIVFVVLKINNNQKTANIISSNFVGYDFARAVTGDKTQVSMLLKPGAEMHDFEPTPEDIVKIKNADLFIYVGGESDEWIEKVLNDNEISKDKTLRLMDLVEVKEEEHIEGMEEEEHEEEHEHEEEVEYDEHIWTSPKNAIKLVNGITEKLAKIYPENEATYEKNANSYTRQLSDIDQQIRDTVASSNKKELIFGDRFPFRYLVDEYGLKYFAAFPGCAEQTEASSKTIAFLIDKVKNDGVKVVLKIELTSDKLAQIVADETGAKVMELNAAHNISSEDFERGVTYVDIMKDNIKVLEEALK